MGKYRAYIRESTGKGRCDLTLLYSDPQILHAVSRDLAAPFQDKGVTKVLALDALGFALGALAALHLNAGLVFVRKAGKIAWETRSVVVTDYSGTPKMLEIADGVLSAADRVLVVDDWSETGAQLSGAIALAEQSGAMVVGAAAINMDDRVLQNAAFANYLLHCVELYR